MIEVAKAEEILTANFTVDNYNGQFIFYSDTIHHQKILDAGLIELSPPPKILTDCDWPVAQYFVISEKGKRVIEFHAL